MAKKSKSLDKKDEINTTGSKKSDIQFDKVAKSWDIPEDELKKTPYTVLKKISDITVKKESYFFGPLPPPSLVKEYEEIKPGSFERIIKMTETNAVHRMEIDRHEMKMEKLLVPESIKIRKSGQNKAFYISIIGIFAVSFCAYLGESTVASILAGTTLISLVPNFILGIKKKKESQDQKKLDS
jgi:uncharacterized membrane protein